MGPPRRAATATARVFSTRLHRYPSSTPWGVMIPSRPMLRTALSLGVLLLLAPILLGGCQSPGADRDGDGKLGINDANAIQLKMDAVKQIRVSAGEARERGDTDRLREDMLRALSDTQITTIETRLDSGDVEAFLSELVDEWSRGDVDSLFELMELRLSEVGMSMKFTLPIGEAMDAPTP